MSRLSVVLALVLLASLLPLATARAGTTYYVSTSGSDANAGTATSPWRTIRYGMTRLSAGDTLLVRGGTYAERIQSPTIQAGTSSARINVAAYPGERPVIQGLLWLRGASYWTLNGINVTWSSANAPNEHMVKFTNGVGWTYINGEVWGARSFAGILVAGNVANEPRDWRIANSCIHDTYPTHSVNQDHNIYLDTGTSAGAGLLEHNLVFNATNGRNLKLGPGGSTGGTVNVTVRYNTFYNSAQPISPSYDSNHNRFERNIIGKSNGTYGLIHAYALRGTDNVAVNNVGFAAPKLLSSSGGGILVKDGGGNLYPTDPHFDSTATCSGFHPALATVASYGRYAGASLSTPAPTATATATATTPADPTPEPTKSHKPHPQRTSLTPHGSTSTPETTVTSTDHGNGKGKLKGKWTDKTTGKGHQR
ncbi:MAG TPA: hypothetical protein VFV72_12585 [Candidatus Limnocylindrales bacterium]|nr:hypothetical protein [Candidatus Limnocylindrales bacterium]